MDENTPMNYFPVVIANGIYYQACQFIDISVLVCCTSSITFVVEPL